MGTDASVTDHDEWFATLIVSGLSIRHAALSTPCRYGSAVGVGTGAGGGGGAFE